MNDLKIEALRQLANKLECPLLGDGNLYKGFNVNDDTLTFTLSETLTDRQRDFFKNWVGGVRSGNMVMVRECHLKVFKRNPRGFSNKSNIQGYINDIKYGLLHYVRFNYDIIT